MHSGMPSFYIGNHESAVRNEPTIPEVKGACSDDRATEPFLTCNHLLNREYYVVSRKYRNVISGENFIFPSIHVIFCLFHKNSQKRI